MTENQVFLYFGIALLGVLFLVISAVLGEVFDFLGDASADGDVNPLSGKVIAVAMTAFGATGMITTYYGWGPLSSALTSLLSALFLGAAAWWIIGLLYTQTTSTDVLVSKMQGRIAEVTVNIAAASVGEVLLTGASGTRQMIARAADGSAIPAGTSVRIVEARGSLLIVERLDQQPMVIRTPQQAQAQEVEG